MTTGLPTKTSATTTSKIPEEDLSRLEIDELFKRYTIAEIRGVQARLRCGLDLYSMALIEGEQSRCGREAGRTETYGWVCKVKCRLLSLFLIATGVENDIAIYYKPRAQSLLWPSLPTSS